MYTYNLVKEVKCDTVEDLEGFLIANPVMVRGKKVINVVDLKLFTQQVKKAIIKEFGGGFAFSWKHDSGWVNVVVSDLCNEFVTQHEIGHVVLGHTRKGFKTHKAGKKKSKKLVLRQELEADAFSARVVGGAKAHGALKKIMMELRPDLIPLIEGGVSKGIAMKRLTALESLM